MKNFFISYSKEDSNWAEWIAWQLEDGGYTTVIQAWDFGPGSDFVQEMEQATLKAERTIAVLSPDYLNSAFAAAEWHVAFARSAAGSERRLVPVRVRECEVEGLLKVVVYIDLVNKSEAEAKELLLAGVRRGRFKPTSPPPLPPQALTLPPPPAKPDFPGTLPQIWNITQQRNLNFTGQARLLDELERALTTGRGATLVAIHGLGGIGKTQLAVEYVYRHAADYDVVWWVKAEEVEAITAEYGRLAEQLNLLGKDASESAEVITAVRHWFNTHANWLLIFDDVTNAASVSSYLPQGGAGHIIITSRDPNWRGFAHSLKMTSLTLSESVAFLLKRTGQQDEQGALDLAEELGGLPLALEQAGAYLESTGKPLIDYLQLFRLQSKMMLLRSRPATSYPHTVLTAWEISFRKIKQQSQASVDLLNLFAFLAPDDIPFDILRREVAFMPQSLSAIADDELAFDTAVALLRSYSLIEVHTNTRSFSVHRLVQAVVRDSLKKKKKVLYVAVAAQLLLKWMEREGDTLFEQLRAAPLVRHLMASMAHGNKIVQLKEIREFVGAGETFIELEKQVRVAKAKVLRTERQMERMRKVWQYIDLSNERVQANDFMTAKMYVDQALEASYKLLGANNDMTKHIHGLMQQVDHMIELANSHRLRGRALMPIESTNGPKVTLLSRLVGVLNRFLHRKPHA